MQKSILCFCPLWNPFSICAVLPALSSVLKKHNISSFVFDFNIDFYRYIFTKNFLANSYKKALDFLENYNEESADSSQREKYKFISEYIKKNGKFCPLIIENIEKVIKIFNDHEDFYNIKKHIEANIYITKAMQLASLPYYPYIITSNYNFNDNILCQKTIEDYLSLDDDDNIFYDFLKEKINEIMSVDSDFIGISAACNSQMLFALTMAKMIKKANKNIFITLGGQHITHTYEGIKNTSIFDCVDLLIYGDGEESLIKATETYKNKEELYKIPNIIYKKDNEIICNKEIRSLISGIPEYCFDGIDFNKYFIPEPVLPIQTSRNCYWGKCVFCNFTHGSCYSQKSAVEIADELQHYKEKYKAKYFYFVDACLEPHFFEKLADEIIKRKLEIYFIALMRAEPQFDEKLLKKLYKAGLRCTSTGFESASQRILDKYKKGTNINNFQNYLKAVKSANIFLNGTFMVGFPDESEEELNLTFKFIEDNLQYFSNFDINKVMIPQYSIINKKRNEFEIEQSQLIEMKEFHIYFLKKNIEDKELTNRIYNMLNKISATKLALTCKQETELLYIAKYGRHNFEKICSLYDEKMVQNHMRNKNE